MTSRRASTGEQPWKSLRETNQIRPPFSFHLKREEERTAANIRVSPRDVSALLSESMEQILFALKREIFI